jgi:hypothetical protein
VRSCLGVASVGAGSSPGVVRESLAWSRNLLSATSRSGGRGEVGVAGVASIGQHGAEHVVRAAGAPAQVVGHLEVRRTPPGQVPAGWVARWRGRRRRGAGGGGGAAPGAPPRRRPGPGWQSAQAQSCARRAQDSRARPGGVSGFAADGSRDRAEGNVWCRVGIALHLESPALVDCLYGRRWVRQTRSGSGDRSPTCRRFPWPVAPGYSTAAITDTRRIDVP